ncbi:unnamed protein product, partial [Adineta ricciae]
MSAARLTILDCLLTIETIDAPMLIQNRIIFYAKLYYFDGRGRAEMPLGQMPVLDVDGAKLPQSMAIARFLSKKFQLAGKDNLE